MCYSTNNFNIVKIWSQWKYETLQNCNRTDYRYKFRKVEKCGDKLKQGGGVAAPVASQVLGEVLPYLEVQKKELTEEDKVQEVEVTNLIGLTIKEAKEILKEIDLEIEYEKLEEQEIKESEAIISEQLPKKGVKIKQKNKVIVQINY